MNLSLNETEALAKRAARGAGYAFGISEDAGKAVRWLVARDFGGADALAAMLSDLDETSQTVDGPDALHGIWQAKSGTLCPLTTGATLSDCADLLTEQEIVLHRIAYPMLIVPFAALCAAHLNRLVSVNWDSVEVFTDGDNAACIGQRPDADLAPDLKIRCRSADSAHPELTAPKTRAHISPETWEALTTFAARTLAPATEASRRLGAGAGIGDAD